MKHPIVPAVLLALLCVPLHAAEPGQTDAAPAATAQPERAREADATQLRDNANRFVVGSLVDVRTVRIEGGDGYHRLLKLESRNGRQIIVDLGPAPPLSAFGFRQGDLLVAMGKSARINGHPVLYAYYVGGLFELAGNPGRAEMNAQGAQR